MGFWDTSAQPEPPLPQSEDEYGEKVVHLRSRKKTQEGWKSEWHLAETGTPLPNLFNAMVAMRNHPKLCDIIRFDEMARVPVVVKQIPGTPDDPGIPRALKDADVIAVQEELQRTGLRRIAKATVLDAVQLRAEQDRFHPVQDYLNSLVWDGEQRIYGWLGRYLGVVGDDKPDGSKYPDTIGKLFLIALVARALQPGCKADYMLILEGLQGAQKSTACAILAGKWFSDNLPDLSRGDAVRLSMHLRGKWLIEIAEMSSFNSAEAHTLKEFLTQTEERYTPKYGRHEVQEPRQCLFIGSTNEGSYLRDATGARRFWPVKVGKIDIEALQRDRDQLLAEAVKLFREGVAWWPDRGFETAHIAPQQDERYEQHPWQEIIENWIAESGVPRTTVNGVLTGPLNIPAGLIGTRQQRDVSAIFRRLGWVKSRSNGRDFYNRPERKNDHE